MKKWMWFIIAMVISFVPGIFGVFFTPHGDSHMWYNGLVKSGLTPPGWVFSVAWTILYFLLGWALYLVIVTVRKKLDKMRAYILFLVQLGLNGLWSYVFFGAHMPGLALIFLLALFIAASWMAREFYVVDRRASYLVIPYLLWLMFAFYLNAYILLMN
ncbi:MAG: tryptophan-rich sensory protein [Alphaproteobacteria bacterium]|nr:tryptophan-rich sensory protein [Alphaproteobacteria bacterium]